MSSGWRPGDAPDPYGVTAWPPGVEPGQPAHPPQPAHQPAPQAATMAFSAPRSLAALLVSLEGDGQHWPLLQGSNEIGRAPGPGNLDVAIPHGTTSSRHAIIDLFPGTMLLRDLGSTNGTFVGDAPLGPHGQRSLRDRDVVRFGGYRVLFVDVLNRF